MGYKHRRKRLSTYSPVIRGPVESRGRVIQKEFGEWVFSVVDSPRFSAKTSSEWSRKRRLWWNEHVGVTPRVVSDWRRGRGKWVQVKTFWRVVGKLKQLPPPSVFESKKALRVDRARAVAHRRTAYLDGMVEWRERNRNGTK